MATNPPGLSRNIRAEMARSGFTQTALAQQLGMSQSALSRRFVDESEWTVAELVRTADVLGCPLASLLPQVAA